MICIRVSEQELSTVLAGLRFFQLRVHTEKQNCPNWIMRLATSGGAAEPLDLNGGIDQLCERLHSSDEDAADAIVREIVEALYADRETGELIGENTIAEKSCADFVEAVTLILDNHGFTPLAAIR